MIDDPDEVLRTIPNPRAADPQRGGGGAVRPAQARVVARLSRPTLNLFLYDVRENQKLRQARPMLEIVHNDDGTVTKRPKPARLDLHYMITAWATEPEDEHRLLSRTLMALFRYPHIPEELLPERLQNQPAPIPMMVAQYDELRNATDVWQVLDNEMRPAMACIVTLAFDPVCPSSRRWSAPWIFALDSRASPSARAGRRFRAAPFMDNRRHLERYRVA